MDRKGEKERAVDIQRSREKERHGVRDRPEKTENGRERKNERWRTPNKHWYMGLPLWASPYGYAHI